MADKTSIEWTAGPDGSPGATWNPVRGCSRVSPGCGGATHACEAADVHRHLRIVWTLCERDVPSNAAYLPMMPEAVTCPACLAKAKGDKPTGSVGAVGSDSDRVATPNSPLPKGQEDER